MALVTAASALPGGQSLSETFHVCCLWSPSTSASCVAIKCALPKPGTLQSGVLRSRNISSLLVVLVRGAHFLASLGHSFADIVSISIFLSFSVQTRKQWNSFSLNDCTTSSCWRIFLPFRSSGVSPDWPGTRNSQQSNSCLESERSVLVSHVKRKEATQSSFCCKAQARDALHVWELP